MALTGVSGGQKLELRTETVCLEVLESQGDPERGSPQPCRGVDAGGPLF